MGHYAGSGSSAKLPDESAIVLKKASSSLNESPVSPNEPTPGPSEPPTDLNTAISALTESVTDLGNSISRLKKSIPYQTAYWIEPVCHQPGGIVRPKQTANSFKQHVS